jgi:hypothetical protein
MDLSYKEKYLKYKTKYLELKELIGGASSGAPMNLWDLKGNLLESDTILFIIKWNSLLNIFLILFSINDLSEISRVPINETTLNKIKFFKYCIQFFDNFKIEAGHKTLFGVFYITYGAGKYPHITACGPATDKTASWHYTINNIPGNNYTKKNMEPIFKDISSYGSFEHRLVWFSLLKLIQESSYPILCAKGILFYKFYQDFISRDVFPIDAGVGVAPGSAGVDAAAGGGGGALQAPRGVLVLEPALEKISKNVKLPGDKSIQELLSTGFQLALGTKDEYTLIIEGILKEMESTKEHIKYFERLGERLLKKAAGQADVVNAKQTLERELLRLQIDLENYNRIKKALEDVPKEQKRNFREVVNKEVPSVSADAVAAAGGGGGVGAASLIPTNYDLLTAIHFIGSKIKEYGKQIETKSAELKKLRN